MAIDPAEVVWDDEPAAPVSPPLPAQRPVGAIAPPPAPRPAPANRQFYNPETVPSSLDVGGLYGSFQQSFPGARVTSTRRTSAENAQLPNSAPDSFHLTGEAWDAVPESPASERAMIEWGTRNGFQVKVEREPYHVHFEPPARGITTNPLGGAPGAAASGIDPNAVQWDDEPEPVASAPVAPPPPSGGTGGAGGGAYPYMPAGYIPVFDPDAGGLAGYVRSDDAGGPVMSVAEARDLFEGKVKPSLFRGDAGVEFEAKTGLDLGEKTMAVLRDTFAGQDSAAKYLAEKTGGRVEKLADGSPALVLPDGTAYRLNDPGFDRDDAMIVGTNVAASFLPASWIARANQARNAGLTMRAASQAVGAGATDAALQAAVTGGEVDPERFVAAGLGGAGGEVAGTAISAGLRAAGSATRTVTGQARAEAIDLARQAGIEAPTPAQINQFAAVARQARAGANPNALIGEAKFRLQYTQGQRLADSPRRNAQLNVEEALQANPVNEFAFGRVREQNRGIVNNFVETTTERLGGRAGATPAELAEGATARLREQADELDRAIGEAYEKAGAVGRTAISADAVAALPQRLRERVRDFGLNPKITPAASETLEEMTAAARGLEGAIPGGRTTGVTIKALETQRRILNSRINAAANPTDRAALTAMKREFDSWIDDAFDQGLTTGDPGALEAMKRARGLRAEFARRFEGKGGDTDDFIARMLDGSRTPEELVNMAYGTAQISKPGAARFVERLKEAAAGDAEVIGQMRAAHFLKMTQTNRGEVDDWGRLISTIKATKHSRDSLVSALYSPAEWAEIQSLANALDPLVAKGVRAKTSGTAERGLRNLMTMLGAAKAIPVVGGFANFRSSMQANAALNAPLRFPAVANPIVPAIGGSAPDSQR